MSGVISRFNHPSSLWPGVRQIFGNKYNEFPLEWVQVFNRGNSDKQFEIDVESTGFGYVPQKSEGGAVQYDSLKEGYKVRYIHNTFAMGYIVTEEEMEDNLYAEISNRRASSLAFSFRQTEEVIHANQFNRAFNAAYTGGDGVSMINAAHPALSGTQTNQIAVAADLSEASLEDILIQIADARDSRGLLIKLMGQKLIVPRQELFNATRLTATPLQPDSDLNNVNAMQTLGMIPEGVMVWHYLTDPDAWFMKTNAPNGIIHLDRVKMGSLQQDNDFGTGNALAKNRCRYSLGWTDWRAMYGSPGA